MDKVDVIILTKDSGRFIASTLASVQRNVPVNNLIVVDGNSTDQTLQIVANFFPEATIITTDAFRAQARMLGIRHVATEFFAFVDSDVVLLPTWWGEVSKIVASGRDVGAAETRDIFSNTHLVRKARWAIRLFHETEKSPTELGLYERGYTHNTIVRTDPVRDWAPPNIHIGEDYSLQYHLIRKNFRWIRSNKYCVVHLAYLSLGESYKRGLNEARGIFDALSTHSPMWFRSYWSHFKGMILADAKALVISIAALDPYIFANSLAYMLGVLRGLTVHRVR
jgi:glycosyltransferase involved in cell wall biosynthesis